MQAGTRMVNNTLLATCFKQKSRRAPQSTVMTLTTLWLPPTALGFNLTGMMSPSMTCYRQTESWMRGCADKSCMLQLRCASFLSFQQPAGWLYAFASSNPTLELCIQYHDPRTPPCISMLPLHAICVCPYRCLPPSCS